MTPDDVWITLALVLIGLGLVAWTVSVLWNWD